MSTTTTTTTTTTSANITTTTTTTLNYNYNKTMTSLSLVSSSTYNNKITSILPIEIVKKCKNNLYKKILNKIKSNQSICI